MLWSVTPVTKKGKREKERNGQREGMKVGKRKLQNYPFILSVNQNKYT